MSESKHNNEDPSSERRTREELFGTNLFHRKAPEGYSQEWLETLKNAEIEEIEAESKSLLIFRIESEWLALPAASIREITDLHLVHKLPHMTTQVLMGLTNVQGALRITISLKALLGFEKTSDTSYKTLSKSIYPRALVFGYSKSDFVFPADEVYGVVQILDTQFEEVPISVSKSMANFTTSVFNYNEVHIGLLDEQYLHENITENHL